MCTCKIFFYPCSKIHIVQVYLYIPSKTMTYIKYEEAQIFMWHEVLYTSNSGKIFLTVSKLTAVKCQSEVKPKSQYKNCDNLLTGYVCQTSQTWQ